MVSDRDTAGKLRVDTKRDGYGAIVWYQHASKLWRLVVVSICLSFIKFEISHILPISCTFSWTAKFIPPGCAMPKRRSVSIPKAGWKGSGGTTGDSALVSGSQKIHHPFWAKEYQRWRHRKDGAWPHGFSHCGTEEAQMPWSYYSRSRVCVLTSFFISRLCDLHINMSKSAWSSRCAAACWMYCVDAPSKPLLKGAMWPAW